MGRFDLDDGTFLTNVHSRSQCAGRPCVIHDPSDHHMMDWPKVWRDDLKYFERQCEHGIGHPDPDDVAYYADVQGVDINRGHGCDGCCVLRVSPEEVDDTVTSLRETYRLARD